ncbi:hypothetical protein MVEG_02673 [Podila verticillata NRRL 6337]|nr:hypothetical protein MVEG_02673 [Podila verticillata NRRL 6337]
MKLTYLCILAAIEAFTVAAPIDKDPYKLLPIHGVYDRYSIIHYTPHHPDISDSNVVTYEP